MRQFDGGRTQAQVVQFRPQIDDVPLLAALRVEAVEHVVVEIDAKGAAAAVTAMDRAGAAALQAATAQAVLIVAIFFFGFWLPGWMDMQQKHKEFDQERNKTRQEQEEFRKRHFPGQ